jgi:hypothetical protein
MRKRTGLFGLAGALLMATPLAATVPAAAASVSVLHGSTMRTAIFPNNAFSVADSNQLTGRRVRLRSGVDYPACSPTNYSLCDAYAMLNKLDGFDLQPRVNLPFSGPIDVSSVNDTSVFVQGPGGRTRLEQLVWDPTSNVLAGITNGFLSENQQYKIVVTSAVKDAGGHPINACGGTCVVAFTTRTASAVLARIRGALDSGTAYAQAGITNRKASFVQGGVADVFPAATVLPSLSGPLNGIVRLDQTTTDPNHLVSSVVPNLIDPATVGNYAFGSFASPRYQFASASAHQDDAGGNTDGVIPVVPSKQTPRALGSDRLGLILVLPPGPVPAGGWPVAIYGPGFTRSDYDIFVSADLNAALGIATIATDPSGHGFGPNSKTTINQFGGASTTFLSYGRGRDLDGDGVIDSGLNDGVGPTAHKQTDGSYLPSRKPIDGLQSGLVQTVVDNMALARSIQAGMDVPGVGNDVLSHSRISYYGISFGGIYGTMLMGTDTQVSRGLLNVPGGPIADIARLSSFRVDLATTLSHGKPDLRNGGPGLNGFTESIPLRQDPPVTNPYPGAIPLQELLANTSWYDRSGSPETFAPLLRQRPLPGMPAKQLLFQTAYGDQTVPNPTAGTLYRAGDLFDLVTYYRNDRTPTYNSDPHGWLANPALSGRSFGQLQLGTFLQSGTVINPNPAWFETPIATIGNLDCLQYPDPQTGQTPSPKPFPLSDNCPTRPDDLNGGFEPTVPIP